jgi:DNA-binding MarR family transcriptional regulator
VAVHRADLCVHYRAWRLPTAPSTDTVELANRLRPVLLHVARALRKEAHALGITGGQATLLGLAADDPEAGMSELAALVGVSPPALTRYVDRMELAGLVTRARSKQDARKVLIVLTPKGIRALRSIRSRRTAWLATRLDNLPPEEIGRIEGALEPLRHLLEGDV